MTEFVIRLKDDSKVSLLLATLKRLAISQDIDLAIEQNGRGIALDQTQIGDARFEGIVNQIIQDAEASRLVPLTEKEQRENDTYWAEIGSALNLSDEDIVRQVKEHRAHTFA